MLRRLDSDSDSSRDSLPPLISNSSSGSPGDSSDSEEALDNSRPLIEDSQHVMWDLANLDLACTDDMASAPHTQLRAAQDSAQELVQRARQLHAGLSWPAQAGNATFTPQPDRLYTESNPRQAEIITPHLRVLTVLELSLTQTDAGRPNSGSHAVMQLLDWRDIARRLLDVLATPSHAHDVGWTVKVHNVEVLSEWKRVVTANDYGVLRLTSVALRAMVDSYAETRNFVEITAMVVLNMEEDDVDSVAIFKSLTCIIQTLDSWPRLGIELVNFMDDHYLDLHQQTIRFPHFHDQAGALIYSGHMHYFALNMSSGELMRVSDRSHLTPLEQHLGQEQANTPTSASFYRAQATEGVHQRQCSRSPLAAQPGHHLVELTSDSLSIASLPFLPVNRFPVGVTRCTTHGQEQLPSPTNVNTDCTDGNSDNAGTAAREDGDTRRYNRRLLSIKAQAAAKSPHHWSKLDSWDTHWVLWLEEGMVEDLDIFWKAANSSRAAARTVFDLWSSNQGAESGHQRSLSMREQHLDHCDAGRPNSGSFPTPLAWPKPEASQLIDVSDEPGHVELDIPSDSASPQTPSYSPPSTHYSPSYSPPDSPDNGAAVPRYQSVLTVLNDATCRWAVMDSLAWPSEVNNGWTVRIAQTDVSVSEGELKQPGIVTEYIDGNDFAPLRGACHSTRTHLLQYLQHRPMFTIRAQSLDTPYVTFNSRLDVVSAAHLMPALQASLQHYVHQHYTDSNNGEAIRIPYDTRYGHLSFHSWQDFEYTWAMDTATGEIWHISGDRLRPKGRHLLQAFDTQRSLTKTERHCGRTQATTEDGDKVLSLIDILNERTNGWEVLDALAIPNDLNYAWALHTTPSEGSILGSCTTVSAHDFDPLRLACKEAQQATQYYLDTRAMVDVYFWQHLHSIYQHELLFASMVDLPSNWLETVWVRPALLEYEERHAPGHRDSIRIPLLTSFGAPRSNPLVLFLFSCGNEHNALRNINQLSVESARIRCLTPTEQALEISQANNPSSASFYPIGPTSSHRLEALSTHDTGSTMVTLGVLAAFLCALLAVIGMMHTATEFFAGVGSLSQACVDHDITVVGICEIQQRLLTELLVTHPQALACTDSRSSGWRHWPQTHQVQLLLGGPMCVPYSIAGPQLNEKHPDAGQLAEMAGIARHLRVKWVAIEEVSELVTNDSQHKMFTAAVDKFRNDGLLLISAQCLRHNNLGGGTRRVRVWPVFEAENVTMKLPQWDISHETGTETHLRHFLDPAETLVTDRIIGTFTKNYTNWRQGTPHVVGKIVFGGPAARIEPGLRVKVKRYPQITLVIMAIANSEMLLFHDDRKKPWYLRAQPISDIVSKEYYSVAVYSIDAIGPTIRNFSIPPVGSAFIIEDTRLGTGHCRPLVGREMWRVHGLHMDVFNRMSNNGFSERELGSLAGSSIPMEMARFQIAKLKHRMLLWDDLQQVEHQTGVPWIHADAPGHRQQPVVKVIAILAESTDPTRFMVHSKPNLVLGYCRQKGATRLRRESEGEHVCAWASILTGRPAHAVMTAEMTQGNLTTILFAIPMQKAAPIAGCTWVTLEQCKDKGYNSLHDIMAVTAARLASFGVTAHEMGGLAYCPRNASLKRYRLQNVPDTEGCWREGSIAATQLAPVPMGTTTQRTNWRGQLLRMHRQQESLRSALYAISDTDPHKEWFHTTADRIQILDVTEFSETLLESPANYSDSSLATLPYPEDYQPPRTKWLPRRPAQDVTVLPTPSGDQQRDQALIERRKRFRPRSLKDLLTTAGIRLIDNWLKGQLEDLDNYYRHGREYRRQYNKVLALGQDMFVAEAQGIIWDLRKSADGIVTPLDFESTSRLDTHLDLDYLQNEMDVGALTDFPDQELLSQLILGIRYKDNTALQIVLIPHLISFADGCKLIHKGIEEKVSEGWYSLHASLPFAPGKNIASGSTPKDGDALNPRPTSDASAPHTPVVDTQGVPVVPQNVAIKGIPPAHLIPDAEPVPPKWAKEVKSGLDQILMALAVLLHVAALSGEPIFFFSDDLAKMFNQLRLAPEQFWKAIRLLKEWHSKKPLWCAEYVMPFGVQCGSNIAQAWAHLFMLLVRTLMDQMEASVNEPNTAIKTWLRTRTKAFKDCKQQRLYYTDCYTDDMIAMVIGQTRTIRFMRAWHIVMERFRIQMAPPKKRQLGCMVNYTGAIIVAVGLLTVGTQKRIRAMLQLRLLLAGSLTLSALQKLNGLLEHFMLAFGLTRNWMFAMYAPFKSAEMEQGILTHPDQKVKPTRDTQQNASKWAAFLATTAGVTASHFTPAKNPLHSLSRLFSWHSDAAKVGNINSTEYSLDVEGGALGLGGYAAGYWWNLPLSIQARTMPIAVLELLALAVNFHVFGTLFEPLIGDHCGLLLHCDSLSSVLTVLFETSKSPMMLFVRSELEQLPVFRRLKPFTSSTHEPGAGNIMADAASRNKCEVLHTFADQLRIRTIRRSVPKGAVTMVDRACAHFRSLTDTEQGLAISQSQNPDSASFPMHYAPPKIGKLLNTNTTTSVAPLKGPVLTVPSPAHPIGQQQHAVISKQHARRMPPSDIRMIRFKAKRAAPVDEPARPDSAKVTLAQKRANALLLLCDTAARDIASQLGHEASEYALVMPDTNIRTMISEVFRTVLETAPAGTRLKNGQDWEKWSNFCAKAGVAAWRGNLRAHSGHDPAAYWGECFLQAAAYMDELRVIQPRSPASPAAKPTSVTVVDTARRIHKYFGVTMAPPKIVNGILKAQCLQFIKNHGQEAFDPQRKEPFSNSQLQALLSFPQGTKLASVTVDRSDELWRSIELLIHVLAQTGLRLADALKLETNAIFFEFRGRQTPIVSKEIAVAINQTDWALLKPGATKSDPLGKHWAPFPVYLPVVPNAKVTAAKHLYHFYADFPIAPSVSNKTPLFRAQGKRLTRTTLTAVLHAMCAKLSHLGLDKRLHSWHSFRIYLACALKAAGCSDDRIKSMVRWVSDDSLHIYARDNRSDYGQWLDKAAKADIAQVQVANLPRMDDDQAFATLSELVNGLEIQGGDNE